MPINKGLGGFCFLKSVKDENITLHIHVNIEIVKCQTIVSFYC